MNDPYFNTQFCIDRLYKEYKAHPKLIIAVDHDDSIYDFHSAGHEYPEVIELVKKCHKLGFWIVLFTATGKEKWFYLQKWWERNMGFPPDSININPIPLPFGNDGKIYYNILLDDRSGLAQSVDILQGLIAKIESKKFYNETERI